MNKQVYGYTLPSNPESGYVGLVAIHAGEDGMTLTVRGHGVVDGNAPAITIPRDEALKLVAAVRDEIARTATPPVDGLDPIMQFFAFAHLPEHLQAISRPFGEMAEWIAVNLPRNPERTVALRKLLEGKDAAVRARLFKSPGEA